MGDQREYCKICNLWFATFEDLVRHKWDNKDHVFCIFCYRDFNSVEGRKRHQDQDHAAVQDLKCIGCDENFRRAGTYIAHIEQHMCPVIHRAEFNRRRVEKEGHRHYLKSGNTSSHFGPNVGVDDIANDSVWDKASMRDGLCPAFKDGRPTTPTNEDEDLLVFDENPVRPAWGTPDEVIQKARVDVTSASDFPSLPIQEYLAGGSKVADLLSGRQDKLDEKNKTWLDLFPDAPRPVSPEKSVAGIIFNDEGIEEYHKFDPDNPDFDLERLWNSITEKYRCCWPRCKSTFHTRSQLYQHLRSPTHMDEKLRCPSCLRQYRSATALVQHAESQAKKCQIRESREYRQAVDMITGGLVDTAGRHTDLTVKYVAPAAVPGVMTGVIPKSVPERVVGNRGDHGAAVIQPPPPARAREFLDSAFPPLSAASSVSGRPSQTPAPNRTVTQVSNLSASPGYGSKTFPSLVFGDSNPAPAGATSRSGPIGRPTGIYSTTGTQAAGIGIGEENAGTGILGGRGGVKRANEKFWGEQMEKRKEQIKKQNENAKW